MAPIRIVILLVMIVAIFFQANYFIFFVASISKDQGAFMFIMVAVELVITLMFWIHSPDERTLEQNLTQQLINKLEELKDAKRELYLKE